MKFRMFTEAVSGRKVAVNVDLVTLIEVADKEAKTTEIWMTSWRNGDMCIVEVSEDFDTVFSRLNTIAE